MPEYEPDAWNDWGRVQLNNNCYNYACDIKTGTVAQPGKASGSAWTILDCDEIGAASISDGLTQIDCDQECPNPQDCHRVALVIADGPGFADFHWYRRDRNGLWSHKPGQTPITNVDASGQLISDPRTADMGPYTTFCGCFCSCAGDVTIA